MDSTFDDLDEEERVTQPVTVYTGFPWLADAKVRFGQWIEDRRS